MKFHRGIIKISLPLILQLLQVPETYIMHECYINPQRGLLCVVVEHPNIPPVEEGEIMPTIAPIYKVEDGNIALVEMHNIGAEHE